MPLDSKEKWTTIKQISQSFSNHYDVCGSQTLQDLSAVSVSPGLPCRLYCLQETLCTALSHDLNRLLCNVPVWWRSAFGVDVDQAFKYRYIAISMESTSKTRSLSRAITLSNIYVIMFFVSVVIHHNKISHTRHRIKDSA